MLGYKDEKDRCLGAAGMAISLVVYNADHFVISIDIDAQPCDMVEYSDDIFRSGSPVVSAKDIWNQTLKTFQLHAAANIGNIICREIVGHGTLPPSSLLREMLDELKIAANEDCALDADETENLFNREYRQLSGVFRHPGVMEVARQFSDKIASARKMTRLEIIDALRALNNF